MSRQGSNPEFLAKAGDASHLPARKRGKAGRFDTPRAQMGREHALDILTDPLYRENLKKRMVMGEGGAIEVWLWRIGYGEPQKDETENELQRAKFEAMRAAVRDYLQAHPDQANIIDAQVQGARRVMPRPILVAKTGGDDQPA